MLLVVQSLSSSLSWASAQLSSSSSSGQRRTVSVYSNKGKLETISCVEGGASEGHKRKDKLSLAGGPVLGPALLSALSGLAALCLTALA